ncbi:conjugal transfer protein [Eubacterium ramulus]|nr:MobA/MobL family protein [Eubacterium ramulus]MSC79178.1 conjugal transfer protein [Eubacterium ramulus]MSC95321.1 conjugal transfer protein [Eubacterium ramulus]RYS92722.1 conjugal transfer protein [Eubacterium ramulus]
MAIFHFTVKIVGRSKGKSVISASAYLNGDVMKNEETGRISYYTSKKEVVYTSLMMCENAPPEWLHVPEENIERFQQSIRYKRAGDKEAALEKFKITFQKQRLWNEVLKVEKSADAQLGRSFEFSLPKEWSRQEQIDYTTEYIQKTFVDKGMCADWSIHDKNDGNPHMHLLVTMRPFNTDHSWGNKEVKEWDFVRDTEGNIVVDESHPDWWQDKKNPDRHGIRIPVLDENGVQKVGARNRKQWKRVLTDATGWNNPKNCELWRNEWAKMCNRHLSIDNLIDHRSYERQGKLKVPTIHEGADARKIEEKYLTGQIRKGSWKVEENQMIKKQNALLQKVIATFGKVSGALSMWRERLNDIRRKQRSNSHDGSNDYTDRGTAEYHGRDASGDTGKGREADVLSGAGRTIAAIRERIIRAASNLAGYRRTADASGRKGRPDTATYRRESAMAGISTEIKQREPAIAETEQRIADIEQQIEKASDIDDRIRKLKERRSTGRIATADGEDAGRTRPERPDYRGTESAARRIADLEREVKQREQSREHSSLKERLEENKRIIAEREKENAHRPSHDRGMSR